MSAANKLAPASATAAVTSPSERRHGRPLPPGWRKLYLAELRKTGLYAIAAENIGISHRTAERARAADPKFDEACLRARYAHTEQLEDRMIALGEKHGNPIPFLARLKAMGRTEYFDKALVANIAFDASKLPHEQIAQLLRAMLGDASTPTTRVITASSPPAETPTTERAGMDSTGFAISSHAQEKAASSDAPRPGREP